MILECPSCQARFNVADSAIPATGRTVRCSRCSNQWHVDKHSAAAAAPEPVKAAPVAPAPTPVETDIIAEMMAQPTPVFHEEPAVTEELSPAAKAEGEAFMSQLEVVLSATEAKLATGTKEAPKRATPVRPARQPRSAKPFMIAVPVIAATWLVLALITYYPKWQHSLAGIYGMLGAKTTEGLVFSEITSGRERGEGSKTRFIIRGSIRNYSNVSRAVPTVQVRMLDKNNKKIWGRDYPGKDELKAGEVFPFDIPGVETVFASSVSTIVVDMGNSIELLVR